MAVMVHFLGFKHGVIASAQRLTVNKGSRIHTIASEFAYDQFTNYVKKQTSFHSCQGEEEEIFYHVFILETNMTMLCGKKCQIIEGFLICGPSLHPIPSI